MSMKRKTMTERVGSVRCGSCTLGQCYPLKDYDYFVYIKDRAVYRNNHFLANGKKQYDTIPMPIEYQERFMYRDDYRGYNYCYIVFMVKKKDNKQVYFILSSDSHLSDLVNVEYFQHHTKNGLNCKPHIIFRGDGYTFGIKVFEFIKEEYNVFLTNDENMLQRFDNQTTDFFIWDWNNNQFIELKKIYPNIRKENNIWKMLISGVFDIDNHNFTEPDYDNFDFMLEQEID